MTNHEMDLLIRPADLAKLCGVRPSTVSGWRKVECYPKYALRLVYAAQEIDRLEARINELESCVKTLRSLD